jgi:hypothetical protein
MGKEETSASVLDLACQLVRVPSRAGVDPYGAIVSVVETWLGSRGIDCTVLRSKQGAAAAGGAGFVNAVIALLLILALGLLSRLTRSAKTW